MRAVVHIRGREKLEKRRGITGVTAGELFGYHRGGVRLMGVSAKRHRRHGEWFSLIEGHYRKTWRWLRRRKMAQEKGITGRRGRSRHNT